MSSLVRLPATPLVSLWLIFIFTLNGFFLSEAAGQPVEENTENQIEALVSLLKAQETQETEVDRLREALKAAETDHDKELIEEQLKQESSNLTELRQRFEESASGVDISIFEEDDEAEAFSWEETLGKILEPILVEVETATSGSRKRNALEAEKQKYSQHAEVSGQALDRLNQILSGTGDPILQEVLQLEKEMWEERMTLSENRAKAATLQLDELMTSDPGFIGGSTAFIRQFLATRGLNLVYGILAALAVFFGVRFLLALTQKIRKGGQKESFANRVFLLTTNLLSIVGAVAALLIAFSAVGDLFLLGIVLIVLIGAAWAGIQVIPQFIESIKLILNIGMVKENQRIVFDDVPWNVESLGFACVLVNKELDEGRQVLPVRRLVGLHSRPWCEDEAGFPTQRGDWVQLSDGKIGQSTVQNPGTVTLQEWGGAEVTYKTSEFLGLAPRNLSRNGFQVHSTFGIDYAHQDIATTEVPKWFEDHLKEKLPTVVEAELVNEVTVFFSTAAASSLDYEILVDLKGEAAPQYRRIKQAVQQFLVEACNQHQLNIPFQQITIHRAGG